MPDMIWVKRGAKIHGPYSKQQIKTGIKSGQVLQSDELARSDAGPWKNVAEAVQPSSKQKNALPASESLPSAKAVSSNSDAPTPLASQSDQLDSSEQLVHQLDTTHFLVEGMAQQQVFENLKQAAALNHTVNGAFLRSGLIRGAGDSGSATQPIATIAKPTGSPPKKNRRQASIRTPTPSVICSTPLAVAAVRFTLAARPTAYRLTA